MPDLSWLPGVSPGLRSQAEPGTLGPGCMMGDVVPKGDFAFSSSPPPRRYGDKKAAISARETLKLNQGGGESRVEGAEAPARSPNLSLRNLMGLEYKPLIQTLSSRYFDYYGGPLNAGHWR